MCYTKQNSDGTFVNGYFSDFLRIYKFNFFFGIIIKIPKQVFILFKHHRITQLHVYSNENVGHLPPEYCTLFSLQIRSVCVLHCSNLFSSITWICNGGCSVNHYIEKMYGSLCGNRDTVARPYQDCNVDCSR